jgi:uncharacterized repeat protein (TIGR01451 family)
MTEVPLHSARLRRALVAGLVLVGAVSAAPVFASGGDSGQRARLEAEVSCDGTVTWEASSSSEGTNGSNPDVRVNRRTDGAAAEEVGQGSFSNANEHRFSGSFEWPAGAEKIELSVVPQGTWGSGSTSKQGETVRLELPDDCDHHPHVGEEVECTASAPGAGTGTVVVTLSNPAGPFGRSARFEVRGPGGTSHSSSYVVESGHTESVEFRDLPDGRHKVTVEVDGESDDHEFEVDCNKPVTSVERELQCLDGLGEVALLLANTGGEPAVFRVEHPITHAVESVEVPAGGSATRRFAGLPDGSWTIPVQAGDDDLSLTVEVNCASSDDHHDDECEDDSDHDSDDESDDDGSETSVEDSSPDSSPETSVEDSSPESSVEDSSPDSSSPDTSVKHSSPGVSVEGLSSGSSPSTDHTSTSVEGSSPGTSVEDSGPDASGPDSSGPDSSVEDSSPDDDDDGHDDDCEEEATPKVDFTKSCVNQDGQVGITLSVTGGDDDGVKFVVAGTTYRVKPGQSKLVVIGGLADGTHTIPITAGKNDMSVTVTIACDLPPVVTVSQECASFDGVISLLLDNPGDDLPATFTVNGTDHVVAPGASATVRIEGLADGSHTVTLAVNGVARPDITVAFDCDPVFEVVARCNTVSSTGAVQVHWFTITNTESVDVTVTWPDGTVLVPAGESRTIASTAATLSIQYAGVSIASAEAGTATCSKDVTVSKTVIGTPPAGEVYTVTIWRSVGGTWDTITSFDVAPGSPVTVSLPSTLDPAGIEYRIEETAKGAASTSSVSPGTIVLSGDQGATVSVTVTNGYAGVSVSKSADVGSVTPGATVEYTLAPTNTGGLTLDPVVVFDRLPDAMSFVSGSVAGDAGSCSLAESTRPQLVKCILSAALAAGDTGPTITLVGSVDGSATPGTTLVNKAKAVGVFGGTTVPAEPDGSTPSCSTVASGTVCALSPSVEVVVDPLPPPPTTLAPTTVAPTTVPPTDPPVTTVPPTDPPPTTVDPCTTALCPPPTDPPVTTVPPTDPPVTTVPPTDPPVTTVPPTDPPVTTVPPTDPPVTTVPPTDPPVTTVPPTDPPVTTTPPSIDPPTPTTASPTTASPTTASPTTAGPTTIAPTTAPATTAPQTTTAVSQEPPVPPTTPAPSTTTKGQSGGLPSTGGTPLPGVLIGFGSICLGLAMVLTRRRTVVR